jgi:bifunctional non-homologous end joining protein LigD
MNLPVKKKFAIHFHQAKKVGDHYDIRFEIPDSKNWDSYATKKNVPLKIGERVIIYRSRWHSEEQALFTGEIKGDGYGAGHLTLWDDGDIIIEKYNPRHIIVVFKGKKIKGRYHILSTYYAKLKNTKNIDNQKYKAFMFFKAKIQD